MDMVVRRICAVLVAAALLSMTLTTAHGDEPWQAPGPAVGDLIGHPLMLPDQTGRQRSLANLAGSRGLTLVFVRSADWCPFCRKQLGELEKRAAAFQAAGYPIVTVSVDTVELVRKFSQASNITYTMLADPTGSVTQAIGIRDSQYPVGSFAYGVPQPGIFVLDTNGRVRAKFFVKGYRERPDPDAVLAATQSLAR